MIIVKKIIKKMLKKFTKKFLKNFLKKSIEKFINSIAKKNWRFLTKELRLENGAKECIV